METISRDLIYYGRNFVFYWVTVRRPDGTNYRWVQAVTYPTTDTIHIAPSV